MGPGRGGGWWRRSGGKKKKVSGVGFLVVSFVVLGVIGSVCRSWLVGSANVRRSGCNEDNEGSWAVGVFYGASPFSLRPIQQVSHDSRLK